MNEVRIKLPNLRKVQDERVDERMDELKEIDKWLYELKQNGSKLFIDRANEYELVFSGADAEQNAILFKLKFKL